MYIRVSLIFGRWTTCRTFHPDFKMTNIFWICCIKIMQQRQIALKNFIFNLAVAKFLPVKMDGKCQIAPLDSIFWAFEIKL